MAKVEKAVSKYMAKIGRKGGKLGGPALARKTSKAQRQEWSRKGGLQKGINAKLGYNR